MRRRVAVALAAALLFSAVPAAALEFKKSTRVEFIAFEGGSSIGPPCEALAYHGYNGIEAEVVHAIATWIKAQ